MNNYTKDKKRSFFLLLLLIGIMLVDAAVFNAAGYSYGRYFAVIIVVLSMFLDIDSTYCLIAFCFPFASILKFSASTISILPILYMIVLLKLIFLKKVRMNVIALAAAVVMVLVQLLYVLIYGSNLISIISVVLNILFVMLSASYFVSRVDDDNMLIKTSIIFLMISVALNILLCDIFPDMPYMINSIKQNELDVDNRFGALFLEPNELAQVILIAIGLFMSVYSSVKNKMLRVLLIAVAVYVGINGIRTNSKSYVLVALGMFILSFVLYLIRVAKQKGAGAVVMRLIPVCVVLAFVSVYFFNNIILPVFEERGSTGTDILSNRGNIWANYLSMLIQRPEVLLGGYGIGNVTRSLTLIGIETPVVPHNLYLEFLIQFGIVGACLWTVAWKGVWSATFKKMKSFFILPFLAFVITSLAISANSNDCFYILMLILAMPFVGRIGKQDRTQKEMLEC